MKLVVNCAKYFTHHLICYALLWTDNTMERLNYFAPYQSKSPHEEDQLTRAFLVVLRYIPLVRANFIDILRQLSIEAGNENRIPDFLALEQSDRSIKTQTKETAVEVLERLEQSLTTEKGLLR